MFAVGLLNKLSTVINATNTLVALKVYMKVRWIIGILLLFFGNSFAHANTKMGLCTLDRTVDSYDPKSWLTAKSRASNDIVPIRFNDNVIYLGYGNNSNIYVVKEKSNKNIGSSILALYEYTDGTSILLSSTEVNTVIIFSVSKVGPLLLGTCELRKKYD